jgi:hypothetical protein
MKSHASHIVAVLLMFSLTNACRRPPEVAPESSSNSGAPKLPFDQRPRSTGVSPSQSLIPSSTKLPEGTPITIRLQTALSSASSHAGDTFTATLDEPLVVDDQMLVPRGAIANGRVLEAKASAGPLEPGYLRVVLVSLNVGNGRVMIYTSSIFAKGVSGEPMGPASRSDKGTGGDRDILFGTDRRLNFRLAQTAELE